MEEKQLKAEKTGVESKVAIGEALPHQCGGNAACGPTEKHDQKKASAECIACLNKEPKQVLASEE